MCKSANISAIFRAMIVAIFLSGLGVSPVLAQEKLEWYPFEEAIAIAEATNRPIFVDVWAPWCGWCRKMKRDVYPELTTPLNNEFILTRLNRDDNTTKHQYLNRNLTSMELAKQLRTQSVPAIVMLNAEGEHLLNLSGYIEADALQPVLKYISSDAYETQTFETFKQK